MVRCTFRNADNVRCVKSIGHVSPHRCVAVINDPAEQNNRDTLIVAVTALSEIKRAHELLEAAYKHVMALGAIGSHAADPVHKANIEAMIALERLNIIIRRIK